MTKFYAYALNLQGKLEQMIVDRDAKTKTWTGKIYKTVKAANRDMERLNCEK